MQEGPSRDETGSLTEGMPEEEQMPVVSIPGSDLLCLQKTVNDKLRSWSFDFFEVIRSLGQNGYYSSFVYLLDQMHLDHFLPLACLGKLPTRSVILPGWKAWLARSSRLLQTWWLRPSSMRHCI